MLIDIQVSTPLHHPQLSYYLIVLTSTSRAMPALPRSETDYERWMRDRDPAIQIREKPQHGPDPVSSHEPVVEYPSSMKHVSNPHLLLYVISVVMSRLALYQWPTGKTSTVHHTHPTNIVLPQNLSYWSSIPELKR
ncbi:hypothetical protein BDV33DRAFT_167758 [Aspergillus novoparasiticus]|uniref:Uncharacterized protein n=1 Tax=Aspergillus novoparasiticus TaxID=986946 RepID=A0A5N6EZM3_9EURO|nr:hypothetical protein BDV33DRAFT_167758 [Aspergillus novoparasiticus]